MVDSTNEDVSAFIAEKPAPKKKHTSMLETSATTLNLLLATGMFSLPYAIYHGGIIMTLVLYSICGFFSYVSIDILFGNMEQCSARRNKPDSVSLIESHPYDKVIEQRPTFIKEKIEMAYLLIEFTSKGWKIFIQIAFSIYNVGSLWVKTVVAVSSLQKAISFILYHDLNVLDKEWGFHTYYLFLFLFTVAAIAVSAGNIENSRMLQVIIIMLRFATVFLMLIGTDYSLYKYGASKLSDIKLWNTDQFFLVFGNLIMINMLQHCAPGIYYPMRPQSAYRSTLLLNIVVSAIILLMVSILGVIAFASYEGVECNSFPCEIKQLYNLNFLHLPVIGYLVNFYPLCNIAAIATISISLRNNIMQMLNYNVLNDQLKKSTKLVWTSIIALFIAVLSGVYSQPENIITFTANYTGTIVMYLMPTIICYYAIKKGAVNTNKWYKVTWCIIFWVWLIIIWIVNTFDKIYDIIEKK